MQKTFHHRTFRFHLCQITTIAATLAFLLAAPLVVRAQDNQNPPAPPSDAVHQPVLRMSDVHGDVRVYRGDLLAFPEAFLNMPIDEGMRIVTGNSGRAEIQFADGSVARLAPNSSLVVEHLDDSSDGIFNGRLRALSGLTYYEFNTQGNQYTLAVGPENVVPQSNAVIRVDMDNTPYQVAAIQGDLQVLDGTSFLTSLQSGQSVSLNPSDAYSYQVSDSIPPNSWDQWNSNRDAALADLASNGGYNSSDNAAWNELDSYGDWYNVPGYGQGWAPSGVGADWDPYGDGAWGYYPSWGYTWISGYPWGWWPYHCGYWNWFGGYGWVWFPGNCGWGGYGGGWYPVSYIQTAPPHYDRLIRPVRPAHAPRHRVPRIYPVRRGNQFGGGFKPFNGSKPSPRPFHLNGKNLQPVRPALPSMQFAPVDGGGQTNRSAAAHPGGTANRVGGARPVTRAPYPILNGGYPSGGSNPRGGSHPGGGSRFGSAPRHAPFFHPRNNGGGNNNSGQPPRSGPVLRPAPRPNPGPRPGPVFHPAPAPRPAPMPRPQPMPRPAPMPHSTFHAAPHPSFHPAPHPAGHPHR
jgi:hypothetical protein